MKWRIILFTICIGVLGVLNAQPVMEWQKNYGGTADECAYMIEATTDGGFIFVGNSESADHDLNENKGGDDFWVVKLTSAGEIVWQFSFGGTKMDWAHAVSETSDGGFVVVGTTESGEGDFAEHQGGSDFLILKLSISGELEWQQTLGGTAFESAYSVLATEDGGFLIAGKTNSNDRHVYGNKGYYDAWLVKLSSKGEKEWTKCYGGGRADGFYDIKLTNDGGYIAIANSESSDGDVSRNQGRSDYWVLKLDQSGDVLWERSYGGNSRDFPTSIEQTKDGGYIIAGTTESTNGDTSGCNYNSDFWVVKLTQNGDLEWQKCMGGVQADDGYDIQQTADEGYVVVGFATTTSLNTDEFKADVSGCHGDMDGWLVKLSKTGELLWQRCLGGSADDMLFSVCLTPDGGLIVAGVSESTDGNLEQNLGGNDVWVVKLSADDTNGK